MEACPVEPPVPYLSDGFVELRPWDPADIPAIVAARQDPEIPRWTRVPDPFGDEETASAGGGPAASTLLPPRIAPGENFGAQPAQVLLVLAELVRLG